MIHKVTLTSGNKLFGDYITNCAEWVELKSMGFFFFLKDTDANFPKIQNSADKSSFSSVMSHTTARIFILLFLGPNLELWY